MAEAHLILLYHILHHRYGEIVGTPIEPFQSNVSILVRWLETTNLLLFLLQLPDLSLLPALVHLPTSSNQDTFHTIIVRGLPPREVIAYLNHNLIIELLDLVAELKIAAWINWCFIVTVNQALILTSALVESTAVGNMAAQELVVLAAGGRNLGAGRA